MTRLSIFLTIGALVMMAPTMVESQCADSEGPCDGVVLLCQTQVCDVASGNCCPATTAAAVATTVAGVTVATSVTSSSVTVTSSTTTTNTTCVDRLNPATGVSDCPARASLCNEATYYAVMTQQCPRTCGRCTTTTSTSTSCVDLLNPATGVSDCPSRASLCNDATYYAVMTQQCPRTCGRCTTSTVVTGTTTTTTGNCTDRLNPSTGVSDCPARAYLCNDATYYTVMTQQCPRTCGRCNTTNTTSTTTTTTGNCTDLLNPSTGVSDCPARASLCNNSVYYSLMTVQRPRTCGRCNGTSTSSSTTAASTTCADLINPATGTSDCANNVALCTNAVYLSLMQTQCPLTCGFCTAG